MQVAKMDANGAAGGRCRRQAGDGTSTVDGPNDRAGADGLAGRDQDARHQWRRLHERQRRASVREPDAALELPPDALDLRHRQRADLLPRPHDEEPGARLGGLGRDDGALRCRRARLLRGPRRRAIRSISNSASPRPTATWRARKCASASSTPSLFATITTAASCGAVNSMHDSFTALGGLVPLFMMQLGEVVIGGVGAGLYGMLVFVVLAVFIAGLMVGPHAGISRQEDRGLRREDGDALAAGALPVDPRLHRLGSGERLGSGRPEQRRAARLQRNSLRLQFRHRATTAAPSPASPRIPPTATRTTTSRSAWRCSSAAS